MSNLTNKIIKLPHKEKIHVTRCISHARILSDRGPCRHQLTILQKEVLYMTAILHIQEKAQEGARILFSREYSTAESLETRMGKLLKHNGDGTSTARLLIPRKARKCALCSGPIRENHTTGERVCKDASSCGHRHGFIEKGSITIPNAHFSSVRVQPD